MDEKLNTVYLYHETKFGRYKDVQARASGLLRKRLTQPDYMELMLDVMELWLRDQQLNNTTSSQDR